MREEYTEELKRKYAEFDNSIRGCAIKLATHLGLDKVKEGEGDHGVWTRMAAYFEKNIGTKCLDEFVATSDAAPYVLTFRHRFDNPCIELRSKRANREHESMASLEFTMCWHDMDDMPTDGHIETFDESYKHFHSWGGPWRNNEVMLWGTYGLVYLKTVLDFCKAELGDRVEWMKEVAE